MELITSKEWEFEAQRAALKGKEVAESRVAAICRDSFATSTLPFINFTRLNSYDKTVGAHPVNSLTKPTSTVPPVDVPSQASQEISPKHFPPVNQVRNIIQVHALAGEKCQISSFHPHQTFCPGSFYDKLQKEYKLVKVNEEISFSEDRLAAF